MLRKMTGVCSESGQPAGAQNQSMLAGDGRRLPSLDGPVSGPVLPHYHFKPVVSQTSDRLVLWAMEDTPGPKNFTPRREVQVLFVAGTRLMFDVVDGK